MTELSTRMAKVLCEWAEREEDIEYVRYGLEILLGGLLKLLIIVMIAVFLDILVPMLSLFLTFAIFRAMTGGHHYSTYLRCLAAGVILFSGFTLLSIKIADIHSTILTILIFCSIAIGVIFIYLYAPSNHFYKVMTDEQKKKLRRLAFVSAFLWGCLMLFSIANRVPKVTIVASCLGFLLQLSTVHPLTYKLVYYIEKGFLERRGI